MTGSAAWTPKWMTLRVLYEQFLVPMELIAEIAGVHIDFVDMVRVKGQWIDGRSTDASFSRLVLAFSKQLQRLGLSDCDYAVEERRAKVMNTLARTLESITSIEKQLGRGAQPLNGDRYCSTNDDQTSHCENGPSLTHEDANRLSTELERLLGNDGEAGKAD